MKIVLTLPKLNVSIEMCSERFSNSVFRDIKKYIFDSKFASLST